MKYKIIVFGKVHIFGRLQDVVMINYFEILNVSENAEAEVIRVSYKALAKKYHPDSYKGSKEEAEKKMALINEAYDILSDESSRKSYLLKLHNDPSYSKKPYTNERKTDANSADEVYKREEKTFSGAVVHPSSDLNAYEVNSPLYRAVRFCVLAVIVISIICCIIYFGPAALKDFWEGIKEEIEQIAYTFS